MASFNRAQYQQVHEFARLVYGLCAVQRKRGKARCVIPNAATVGNRARSIAIETEAVIGQVDTIPAELWKELS